MSNPANSKTDSGNDSKNMTQRSVVSIEVHPIWADKFMQFAKDREWTETDLFVLMCERYEATIAPFYPLASSKARAGQIYDYGIFKAE